MRSGSIARATASISSAAGRVCTSRSIPVAPLTSLRATGEVGPSDMAVPRRRRPLARRSGCKVSRLQRGRLPSCREAIRSDYSGPAVPGRSHPLSRRLQSLLRVRVARRRWAHRSCRTAGTRRREEHPAQRAAMSAWKGTVSADSRMDCRRTPLQLAMEPATVPSGPWVATSSRYGGSRPESCAEAC